MCGAGAVRMRGQDAVQVWCGRAGAVEVRCGKRAGAT